MAAGNTINNSPIAKFATNSFKRTPVENHGPTVAHFLAAWNQPAEREGREQNIRRIFLTRNRPDNIGLE